MHNSRIKWRRGLIIWKEYRFPHLAPQRWKSDTLTVFLGAASPAHTLPGPLERGEDASPCWWQRSKNLIKMKLCKCFLVSFFFFFSASFLPAVRNITYCVIIHKCYTHTLLFCHRYIPHWTLATLPLPHPNIGNIDSFCKINIIKHFFLILRTNIKVSDYTHPAWHLFSQLFFFWLFKTQRVYGRC